MPSVFPAHLQHHINQIKRDIDVVEAQVNALSHKEIRRPWREKGHLVKRGDGKVTTEKRSERKKINERAPSCQSKDSGSQTYRQDPESHKLTDNDIKTNRNRRECQADKNVVKEVKTHRTKNSERAEKRSENNYCCKKIVGDVACSCCQDARKCSGQVSTRICSKNHVHHILRIPLSSALPSFPKDDNNINGDRTWRDFLTKSHKGSERGEQECRKKQQNEDATISEVLKLLQDEVKQARNGKIEAQKEAIEANLAKEKLQILLETNAASTLQQQRCLLLLQKRLEEHIEEERMGLANRTLNEILAELNTSSNGSSSSSSPSRRFRASSPAKSEKSAASALSWHAISSIRSSPSKAHNTTFKTI